MYEVLKLFWAGKLQILIKKSLFRRKFRFGAENQNGVILLLIDLFIAFEVAFMFRG